VSTTKATTVDLHLLAGGLGKHPRWMAD